MLMAQREAPSEENTKMVLVTETQHTQSRPHQIGTALHWTGH